MIITGWPDDINDVPHALSPYHDRRNILMVEDGLILQGKALIIPPSAGRRSSKQYMKETWELTSAKTEQDTPCIGQESTQTSNISLNHTQHANVTAHRNHDSSSSQLWPWNAHGNSLALTTSTLTDLNT